MRRFGSPKSLPLATEVAVEGGSTRASSEADSVHRGRGVALVVEDGLGSGEQAFPLRAATFAWSLQNGPAAMKEEEAPAAVEAVLNSHASESEREGALPVRRRNNVVSGPVGPNPKV